MIYEKTYYANTLIIGGLSGLGLEIGKLFSQKYNIYATSRKIKKLTTNFSEIELNVNEDTDKLLMRINEIVKELPYIDNLVYAAGFTEDGHVDELTDEHISTMINVGITTPAIFVKSLLKKQNNLNGLITITSTSQWIPREKEPIYCAVKAGAAMLSNSISLDARINKTLVVGPTGMVTNFWKNSKKDTLGMLSPDDVATEIIKLWNDSFTYRLARILRDPKRVEILETRK